MLHRGGYYVNRKRGRRIKNQYFVCQFSQKTKNWQGNEDIKKGGKQ